MFVMKTRLMATTLSLFLVSGIVNAEMNEPRLQNTASHMYLGLLSSFLDIDVEVDGLGRETFDNSLLGVSIGYQFHNNFAFEVRGYGNVSDDDFMGISVEVDHHFSAIGKVILPINRSFRTYAVLGYGRSKASFGSFSDHDEDFIYGVGFTASNDGPLQLELEWVRLHDERYNTLDITGDSINLNLVYHY